MEINVFMQQLQIKQKTCYIKQTILEFNSGGHFADSGKRLAKAVKWLLENRNENQRGKNDEPKK